MVSWSASFARDRPAPLSVQNCGQSKQLHLACELVCSCWVKIPGFWDSSRLRGRRTQPLVGYQRLAARDVRRLRTGTVVPKHLLCSSQMHTQHQYLMLQGVKYEAEKSLCLWRSGVQLIYGYRLKP